MTITDKYVLFFGEYWPSNFAPSPITVYDDFWEKGLFGDEPYFPPTITFKTAEAYYQSRKAVFVGDKERYYKIALAQSPGEAKKIAREIKLDPKEWNKVRVKCMEQTLKLKFEQNPELKSKFLDPSLDGKIFIEASPWDGFWGAKMDEKELIRMIERDYEVNLQRVPSVNMLGQLLNKYRSKIFSI